MAGGIHLLKLCVGVESVGDLEAHIAARGARQQVHVTRMWPKKSDELLDGGSLYWVIKGTILARQRITGFEPRRGEDGIERCAHSARSGTRAHPAGAAPSVPGLALPARRRCAGGPGCVAQGGSTPRTCRGACGDRCVLRECGNARIGFGVGARTGRVRSGSGGNSRYGYNWDEIGTEFCRLTLANDMAGLAPLLTGSLRQLIEAASANPELPPARTLFQTYVNEVSGCSADTRNAALVEIARSNGGRAPAWTDILVISPEADGTSRIDDVLFATRKSDTLRARLQVYAGR